MRSQYQGLRAQAVTPSVTVVGGGTTTGAVAGTYYVYLMARNRGGFNLASQSVAVDVTAGDQLQVTIPADARRSGEDVQESLVLLAKEDNPVNAVVVASFPGYEADGVVPVLWPTTLTLTADVHFALEQAVAEEADLPGPAERLHGMLREVAALGYIVAYNDYTASWERIYPNTFTPYVTSSFNVNGANADFRDVLNSAIFLAPAYAALGGESAPVGYWIVNDQEATLPQGTRVTVRVAIDGENASELLSGAGALTLKFLGYADTVTGVLDTTAPTGGDMVGIDEPITYRAGRTNLVLRKPLPANSAYVLSASLNFQNYQIEGKALQGSQISLFPAFAVSIGSYNVIGQMVGDVIFSEESLVDDNLRRIVPQDGLVVKGLPGSGSVDSQIFNGVGEQLVPGFSLNRADQGVIVTGNGSLYVRPSNIVPDTTARRALVSTVNGAGNPTGFSSQTVSLSASQLLNMTVQYPVAIRDNYPDVIAGYDQGEFNGSHMRVYVQAATGGNIAQYQLPVSVDVESESFVLGDFTGSNVGTVLPGAASESFGLFEFGAGDYTIGTTAGASGFESKAYHVAIAPYYENTVTEISHAVSDGCIREFEEPLVNYLERIAQAITRDDHALLEGEDLHESKLTSGFTGDVSAASGSYVGQLLTKTDSDPELLYRVTSTTPGGLKPVGGVGGVGGGGGLPLDYLFQSSTTFEAAAPTYFVDDIDNNHLSLSALDSGFIDISAIVAEIPRRSLLIIQDNKGEKRRIYKTWGKVFTDLTPVIFSIPEVTFDSIVVITGLNFTGATQVEIGEGYDSPFFTVDSDTQITAEIASPEGAYFVYVTTLAGRGVSDTRINVYAPI